MEISLTDFVEFTLKTGSARLTKVKQIKERPQYHPSYDYWKILRDKIIDYHQTNEAKISFLEDCLNTLTNKSKVDNYKNAIDNYLNFIKKKNITWFEPPYSLWKNSELTIRINPELGLVIDDSNYVIKLYFGSEKISKSKINMILTLMNSQFDNLNDNFSFSVLDVKNKKLHINSKSETDKTKPLIIGEAFAFEHIWNNI